MFLLLVLRVICLEKEMNHMDFRQLEYIIRIAEERNITRAAEKLFLTQSALNQHLLKLEKELGTRLFVRTRSDWHPTEAGEIYLKNAKKILGIQKETYNRIGDLTHSAAGHLSIGLTPERGISMFAAIYPDFHARYPDAALEPLELNVQEQLRMIREEKLDLGFLTLKERPASGYHFIHLMEEELLLAVPASHPLAKSEGAAGSRKKSLSLADFAESPFVLLPKNSTIRDIVDPMFREAGFLPKILFETRSNQTVLHMVEAGLCCAIIPESYALDSASAVYFSLPGRPSWEVAACYKKGTYFSAAAREIVEMAREYWGLTPLKFH